MQAAVGRCGAAFAARQQCGAAQSRGRSAAPFRARADDGGTAGPDDEQPRPGPGQRLRNAVSRRIASLNNIEAVPEQILGLLLRNPQPPIGSYVASPVTFLHQLDPRVKQAWMLALLLLPLAAELPARVGLAASLAALSVATFPPRVHRPQLAQLTALCAALMVFTSLGSDAITSPTASRLPPAEMEGLPARMPSPVGGYRYTLLELGPLQVTRRGVGLGATSAAATFAILQSTWLLQASTPPEAIAASLRWLLQPAGRLGGPAAAAAAEEAVLSLLLAIRFTGLVYDEVRNLAAGVAARGILWGRLPWLQTAQMGASLTGRLMSNLFDRAERITEAMRARGYGAPGAEHTLYLLTPLHLTPRDWAALAALAGVVVTTVTVSSGH